MHSHTLLFPLISVTVPRFGDIHSHLGRWDLYNARHPALRDYMDVQRKYATHPCFPMRVLAGLNTNHFVAECVQACPVPIAFDSPERVPSPDIDEAERPLVDGPYPRVDDVDMDQHARSPSPSELESPRTFLRRSLPPLISQTDSPPHAHASLPSVAPVEAQVTLHGI